MKTVALLRVSTKEQDYQYQKTSIEIFAKDNGLIVDEWIEEFGVSGYRTAIEDRCGLNTIIDMAKRGEINYLIIDSLDRIGRNTQLYSIFLNLNALGVKVLSINDADLNATTLEGQLQVYIKFWTAQHQAREISKKSAKGILNANLNGYVTGGVVPLGYETYIFKTEEISVDGKIKSKQRKKYKVNEYESEVVKKVFEYYIEYGTAKACRKLNEEGLLKRGNIWDSASLNMVLKDPIYIGTRRYNFYKKTSEQPTIKKRVRDWDNYKTQEYDQSLQIIDDSIFSKVQKLLQERKTKDVKESKNLTKSDALLQGLVYHKCADGEERKMMVDYKYYTSKKTNEKDRWISYRCQYCRRHFTDDKTIKKGIGGMKVHKVINNEVVRYFTEIDVNEVETRIANTKKESLNLLNMKLKQINKSEKEKNKLLEEYIKSMEVLMLNDSFESSRNIWFKKIEDLNVEINNIKDKKEELKCEISELSTQVNKNEFLLARFKDFEKLYKIATEVQKKLILNEVIDYILIDGDNIKIFFKVGL